MRQVVTGQVLGFVPYAHVLRDSQIIRTFYGLTTAHAKKRADHWNYPG